MENSLSSLEIKKAEIKEEINNKWWWNFWTTILFWIGILVFLAFLGLNVFSALGETSDFAGDIINKIKNFIISIFDYLGVKLNSDEKDKLKSKDQKKNVQNPLLNHVSNSQMSGVDKLQKSVKGPNSENVEIEEDGKIQNYIETDSFNKRDIPSLQSNISYRKDAKKESLIDKRFPISDKLPEPYETNTFNTISTGHGYCFIGEDKGVRSCIKTEDVGSCPTGLGYQSQEICQNPQLRD